MKERMKRYCQKFGESRNAFRVKSMNKPLKHKKSKFFNIPLFPDLLLIVTAVAVFALQGYMLLK